MKGGSGPAFYFSFNFCFVSIKLILQIGLSVTRRFQMGPKARNLCTSWWVVGSEGFRWEEAAQRSGTLGLRPKQRCYLMFPHSASSLLTPPPSSIDKGRLTLKATVWPEGGGVSAPAVEHLTSGLLPWPVALLLAADSLLFLVS